MILTLKKLTVQHVRWMESQTPEWGAVGCADTDERSICQPEEDREASMAAEMLR